MPQRSRSRGRAGRVGDPFQCRNRYQFQLRLEALENRHLLATFTVDYPLDVMDPGDGLLTLREAVQAANTVPGADTINFDRSLAGSTVLLTNGEITISDLVTVNGSGRESLTVSGNNQSRVFHVTDFAASGDVIFRGLTITGGNQAGDGGGIVGYHSITIEDCALSGNTASGNGGALAVGSNTSGNPAGLIIHNSVLSGNTSLGSGGGVFSAVDLSIHMSSFSGNVASFGGGGVASHGTTYITGSTVNNNAISGLSSHGGSGGGIAATGELTIHDSVINGNSAGDGYTQAGDGGGIWASGVVSISASHISSNSAGNATRDFSGEPANGGDGGGIWGANVTITESTISHNSAGDGSAAFFSGQGGDGGRGGGIYADNVVIVLSNVSSNLAGSGAAGRTSGFQVPYDGGNGGTGGGIEAVVISILDSNVIGNTAGAGGGGAGGCYFVYVCGTGGSGGSGGGVHGEIIEITGSLISHNVAGSGGAGGVGGNGDQSQGGRGGIGGQGGDGGGILGSTVTLLDTTVSGNAAGTGGAGGRGGYGSSELFCCGGQKGGNGGFGGRGGNGGGTGSDSVSLTGGAILSNSAGSGGAGGTGGNGGRGFFNGGSGGDGAAGGRGGNGGAIFAGQATISTSTISGNQAGNGSIGGVGGNGGSGSSVPGGGGTGGLGGDGGSGGGIYGDTVSMVDARVNQGIAGAGGGGGDAGRNGQGLVAGDAGVGGNGGSGGGIFSSVIAHRTTVSNSNAGGAGSGGIGSAGVASSGMGGLGGGIAGLVTLNDSTISGNSSPRYGGGIWSDTSFAGLGSSRVANSTISGNSASVAGGGVFNQGGLFVIQFSTITNNSALSNQGSGIANYRDVVTRTEVTSSIVAGNVDTDFDELSGFSLGSIFSGGYNLIGTGNGVPAFNNSDLTGITDPGLFPLANYGGLTETHALMLSSPAIDAGDPLAMAGVGIVPILEQRGFKRVGNARIDIGAVELDYSQSCDFPAPVGLLDDGYSDLIYNQITGILSLRMDTDLFPADGITELRIGGPQPLAAAAGAPTWQTFVYANGVMQLAMPNTPPARGIESNVPLLQYDAGLQSSDFGCIEYHTINGLRTFARVYLTSDIAPPAATVTPPFIAAGTSSSQFEVVYTDNSAVLRDSISGDTVLVTGPNGYSAVARFVTTNPPVGSHPVIRTTYSISAPGGLWDDSDFGQYTIEVLPSTVTDTVLNVMPTAPIGTFDFVNDCDFPVPSGIPEDGYSDLIYNQATGILSLRIDSSQFPQDGLVELFIGGPQPQGAAAGAPTWQSSTYVNGTMQLAMPGTTPGMGIEANVPLLQYSPGLQGTDFGCVEYRTVQGSRVFTRVHFTSDTKAPTVVVAPPEIVWDTTASQFEITFSDNVSILGDSIVGDIVLVSGPNGYSEIATLIAATPPSGNSPVVEITFSIPAPGGRWDGDDVGQYAIEHVPFNVSDVDINFAPGGLLAYFDVNAVIELGSLLASQGGNGTNGFVLNGGSSDDNMGQWVSVLGDINGDDYDDLLVTAPNSDVKGSNSGAAYVVYGRNGGFPAEFDVGKLAGSNGFIIHGAAAGDTLGIVAGGVGDINYDGLDDFAITSLSHDGPAGNDTGAVYVIYGSATAPLNPLDVGLLNGSSGFAIYGLHAGDQLSAVDSAGDVNGDGIDDLILGAWLTSPSGRTQAGQAYVVFGRNAAFPATFDLASLNGTKGFMIDGAAANDQLGHKVSSAGDVDGDGYGDLLVGAISADLPGLNDVGKSYVLFGKPHGYPAAIDLATLSPDIGFTLSGIAAGDYSSTRIDTVGDMNGDGLSDLIITAFLANGGMGEAYVVFGDSRAELFAVSLSTLDGTNGFRIPGIIANQQLGLGVKGGGDVNGDGLADVVIGAPNTTVGGDTSIGRGYLIFGRSTGYEPTLDLGYMSFAEGITLAGAFPGDRTGTSVGIAGDINGDGYDELLIGAPNSDPQGRGNAGRAYLVFGRDFSDLVTHQGTPGTDAIPGTSAGDIIVAGNGNDVLGGLGGADVLKGARGNDQLLIFDTSFRRVFGGHGRDRMGITGAARTLDLTSLSSLQVSGIEEVDLTGTGSNLLILTRLDLLNLSRESNQLLVDGNAGDSVNLGAQWIRNGTELIGGQAYTVFVSGNAVVKVRQAVATTAQIAGDYNGDGLFNCQDVNPLVAAIAAGQYSPQFDLNFDFVLDRADLLEWLAIAGAETLPSGAPYLVGDANLNGVVDGSDFNIWNSNKFTAVAAWCSGDFNADGVVDGSDFNLWNANKFQSADAQPRAEIRLARTGAMDRDRISDDFTVQHQVSMVLRSATANTRVSSSQYLNRARSSLQPSSATSERDDLFAQDLDCLLNPWESVRRS